MSRTKRLAVSASALVLFLDNYSRFPVGGHPRRRRHTINDIRVDPNTDARVIRRWRANGGATTKPGAVRLLCKFNLTLDDYTYWCSLHNLNPTIRGEL